MSGKPEVTAPPRAGLTRAEAARLMDTLAIARGSLTRIRTRGGDDVPEVAAALANARRAVAELEEVAELVYSVAGR